MAVAASALWGCRKDDKATISYLTFNHTGRSIVSIIVNGEGGVLNAHAHGGGGEACCVILPARWMPGLTVTIKWQEDGHWIRDDKGQVIIKDGDYQFAEGPWHEKTVPVPPYAEGDQMGQFRIHFFPNNDVKVTVLPYGPGDPRYPYPAPNDPNK
jgi:hypothetical protein